MITKEIARIEEVALLRVVRGLLLFCIDVSQEIGCILLVFAESNHVSKRGERSELMK